MFTDIVGSMALMGNDEQKQFSTISNKTVSFKQNQSLKIYHGWIKELAWRNGAQQLL